LWPGYRPRSHHGGGGGLPGEGALGGRKKPREGNPARVPNSHPIISLLKEKGLYGGEKEAGKT